MIPSSDPVFLDSSGLIALLADDDPNHLTARRAYSDVLETRRRRVTTAVVICEIGDGFARRGRWSIADSFLRLLLTDPQTEVVPLDLPLLQRALALKARRQDKRWGLTDCVSFVVMQERGIAAALTADRDFAQAGFRALLLDR